MTVSRVIVVVTGMSGAGRSTALRVLEDLAFFCIDNLPIPLLAQAVGLIREERSRDRVGLGIDVRSREFLEGARDEIRRLREGGDQVIVLFLDSADDALVRRFSESRRPHPLAATNPLDDLPRLIARERDSLADLRDVSDRVIDTTRLTVHDLRRLLIDHFATAVGTSLRMAVRVQSFGFKYGVPMDADTVFDARFLPNPHFVPELRPRSGKDPEVAAFVLDRSDGVAFLDSMAVFLTPLLPRYAREGKVVLTVAIGCTGGRHRSVALSDALGQRLIAATAHGDFPCDVTVSHRDIERGG